MMMATNTMPNPMMMAPNQMPQMPNPMMMTPNQMPPVSQAVAPPMSARTEQPAEKSTNVVSIQINNENKTKSEGLSVKDEMVLEMLKPEKPYPIEWPDEGVELTCKVCKKDVKTIVKHNVG